MAIGKQGWNPADKKQNIYMWVKVASFCQNIKVSFDGWQIIHYEDITKYLINF